MRLPIFSAACLLAAAMVASGSSALAQYGYYGPYTGGRFVTGGTPASYYAHGYADVVRSAGAYNLMTSQAYRNLEDARRKYIDNRLHWTKTYFEMRKMNRAYRKAAYEELYPPKTQEDFIRYAQQAAPKRLSSTQLDPITGYVAWPRLLLRGEYADLRKDLDTLFSQRANAQGAIGNDVYFEILEKTGEMKARLKKTIRKVPTHDYLKARTFLDSLAYEARHAPG